MRPLGPRAFSPKRPPSAAPDTPLPTEPEGPDTRRLPPLLRRAWYGLNQSFRRRLTHLDLTPDQYTVLRTLSEAGREGLTQSGLTAHMASDPNTIASLVDRMGKAGLLKRETDPDDRRARRLRLVPAGRRKFREAWDVASELQEEILGCLQPEEHEVFLRLLERVAASCRAALENEPRKAAHVPDSHPCAIPRNSRHR